MPRMLVTNAETINKTHKSQLKLHAKVQGDAKMAKRHFLY